MSEAQQKKSRELPRLSPRLRRDLRYVFWSSVFAGGIGIVIGGFVGWTLNMPLLLGIIQGMTVGAVIGGFTTIFSTLIPNLGFASWFKDLPFAASVAIKTLVSFLIIVVAIRVGVMIFFAGVDQEFSWRSPQVLISMAISGYLILSINFATDVNRMLGQRVLLNFATGAYHRPREEDRIFLFIDVIGSTGIAERIGPIRFHAFLDQFFGDLSNAILQYNGEIHKYVGDEVIISWPYEKGRKGEPIACYFASKARIDSRERYYQANFGFMPKYRAALHAGRVVTGELGDIKREIVFLGDTVNTCARLVGVCDDLDQDFIGSEAALAIMEMPEAVEAKDLGLTEVRGRQKSITLFGLYSPSA